MSLSKIKNNNKYSTQHGIEIIQKGTIVTIKRNSKEQNQLLIS